MTLTSTSAPLRCIASRRTVRDFNTSISPGTGEVFMSSKELTSLSAPKVEPFCGSTWISASA